MEISKRTNFNLKKPQKDLLDDDIRLLSIVTCNYSSILLVCFNPNSVVKNKLSVISFLNFVLFNFTMFYTFISAKYTQFFINVQKKYIVKVACRHIRINWLIRYVTYIRYFSLMFKDLLKEFYYDESSQEDIYKLVNKFNSIQRYQLRLVYSCALASLFQFNLIC